ncbi:Chitinase 1 [Mortierella alpina]|uniref:chitinase n=1 Tax=Mortierella alpina TaxID=64518 RepID=A0A9P6IYP7_MORAP|nr:Chitinase 1 [Mortierella alpina]
MVRPVPGFKLCLSALLSALILSASAFNIHSDDNLVNYWGQKYGPSPRVSYGASGGDMRLWQKPLADYCQTSDGEDVIVLAFLHVFNSAQRALPRMDLSNQCNPSSVFPGTSLLHCPQTGAGVKLCQSKGKAVILSLGGAAGAYGFSNDAEGKDFAHMIWNLFLGGASTTRPLDDAVLDGVDLDIEGGSTVGYKAFVDELRSLYVTDPKKQYYISAAPQCPYPDAYLGATLQSAWVDMVFVQYYNNYCGTQGFGSSSFNFEQWDTWAKTVSLNKAVKIYLGVPASRTAANGGYVAPERLREIMDAVRCKYSSFGGVMMWDVSQAYSNLDSSGTQYSIQASRHLKRSRDEVCNESPAASSVPSSLASPSTLPIASPVVVFSAAPSVTSSSSSSTSAPSSSSSSSASSSSSSSSAPAISPPASSPPPSSSAPASASSSTGLVSQIPAVQAYSPETPPPPPQNPQRVSQPNSPSESLQQQDGKSKCRVLGETCTMPVSDVKCDGHYRVFCLYGKWYFQSCAPGTYCTGDGQCVASDGITVKNCAELEQDGKTTWEMKRQMHDTIERMWSAFDNVMHTTWSSYLGMDSSDQTTTENKHTGSSLDAHQHAFEVPSSLETKGGISDDPELFLIDFVELDPNKEFVGFQLGPQEQNATTWRTQVRIRTNGAPISSMWRVSFYVKPGEFVRSTTKGVFHQQGLRVTVTSDPKQEAEQNMVVRFVVDGVRAMSIENVDSPEASAPQTVFEASSLPDPAFASFETARLHDQTL